MRAKAMDTATISLAGAILVAAASFLFQKEVERKRELRERKRQAYAEFLRAFAELTVRREHGKYAPTIPQAVLLHVARMQLLLYASDPVVRIYRDWKQHAIDQEKNKGVTSKNKQWEEKDQKYSSDLLYEIRKDVVGETHITAEDCKIYSVTHR